MLFAKCANSCAPSEMSLTFTYSLQFTFYKILKQILEKIFRNCLPQISIGFILSWRYKCHSLQQSNHNGNNQYFKYSDKSCLRTSFYTHCHNIWCLPKAVVGTVQTRDQLHGPCKWRFFGLVTGLKWSQTNNLLQYVRVRLYLLFVFLLFLLNFVYGF